MALWNRPHYQKWNLHITLPEITFTLKLFYFVMYIWNFQSTGTVRKIFKSIIMIVQSHWYCKRSFGFMALQLFTLNYISHFKSNTGKYGTAMWKEKKVWRPKQMAVTESTVQQHFFWLIITGNGITPKPIIKFLTRNCMYLIFCILIADTVTVYSVTFAVFPVLTAHMPTEGCIMAVQKTDLSGTRLYCNY